MRSLALSLSLLLALALATPAMGQGSGQDGYIQEGPAAIDRTSGGDGDGQSPGASTSLPFTGMDLVLVAALGAVLLGAGLGMRQLTRPPAPPPA